MPVQKAVSSERAADDALDRRHQRNRAASGFGRPTSLRPFAFPAVKKAASEEEISGRDVREKRGDGPLLLGI